MGAKKFKNLFKSSGGSNLKASSTNKGKGMTPEKVENNNIPDKQTIEQLKKAISKKMNDPKMAKKAAQIIADMLDKK